MPSKSKPATFIAALAAATCMGSNAADESVMPLPQVTVYGKKANVPVETPNPSESITAAQMEEFNVVNSEDALKYAPNIAVRKRYIGDRNSIIAVRSTSSRQSARSVVYADGLLLSNFLGSDFGFPPRWALVAPEEISQINILYGPYSALYPGNSLGSTVLITTKMPTKFEGYAKVQAFSQQFGLYDTHDTFTGEQLSASLGNKHDKFSYLVSFDRLDNKSQPLSFATLTRSSTAANGGDTAVSGAYQDRDQAGNNRVILGTNSEGVDHTIQDQIKSKLVYDFSPFLQGIFTVGYWQQERDSSVTSYLRDVNGNPVTSGPVNVNGLHYDIPASTFAPSNGEDARWLYGLSLKTRNPTGWNYEAVVSLFDIAKDTTRTSNTAANSGAGIVTYGDGSGWKNVDLKADYTPQKGRHRISLGYHFDNYRLQNRTYNASDWQSETLTTQNSTFFGKTKTHALFAQDAWQFADAWKLIFGGRWERWEAYDGSRSIGNNASLKYAKRSESRFSPKASVEYVINDQLLSRFSIGKAYRFPTVSELFQGRIAGNSLINNDPNLKPENALSKDITFERYLDDGKVRLSLYEDDVRDVLFSQLLNPGITTTQTIQNVDRVRTRGIEIAYNRENFSVRGLEVNASVAYNQAITLENANNPASVNKRFYRIPLWRADLVGTYHHTAALAYTLAARYSGRQHNTLDNSDVNPNTFGGTSSYTVFDTKLTYKIAERVKIGVGVDNITDRRYYVYHPYPGRTIYGEGKFSF